MRLALLVCLVLPCCAVEYEITGTVTDPTGTPVVGAQVVVNRSAATTSTEGRFRLGRLSQGKHNLVVQAEGFAPWTKPVQVPSSDLAIRLAIRDVHTSVTVTAEPALEAPPAQMELNSETLAMLPTVSEDALTSIAAWLGPMPGAGGGLSVVVDGIETPVGKLSQERIAEVRIHANAYSAEFTRPGSSRIEIRTKSGSDHWRGKLSSHLRDSRLDARPAFALTKPGERRNTLDATISGPLNRKTTLLLSAEADRRREQSIILARTPAGEVRQALPSPESEIEARVVLTRAPFTLRYSAEFESTVNDDIGGFRLPETGVDQAERGHELQLAIQRVHGGWLVETQVRFERTREQTASLTPGVPTVIVDEAFIAGGAQADHSTQSFAGRMSQTFGRQLHRHTLKTGVQSPGFRRVTLWDRTAREGSWRFASLDDYERGAPYAFSMRRGQDQLTYNTSRFGAFVQDEWRISPTLALSLGVRYDVSFMMDDHACVAPRLGVAWRVGRDTVLRIGGGMFYDFIGEQTWRDTLRFRDIGGLREVLLRNPPYPLPPAFDMAQQPPNLVHLGDNLRAPRVWESSVTVEHSPFQLRWRTTRGARLFGSVDSNAPMPETAVRPRPDYGQIRTVQSHGRLESHAFEADVKFPFVRISGRAGRTLSDTEGESFLPANSYKPAAEWGYDNSDRPWAIQAISAVKAPAALRLGAIWRAQSAAPYTLRIGRDENHDGLTNDRPAGIHRNTLRASAEMTLDLRIAREFRKPGNDNRSLEVAATAFNALNRANYPGFVGTMSSPLFGRPTSTRAPRRLDLSLILRF